MALVLDASVGGIASNSYETKAEATAYFDSRLPLVPSWDDADSQDVLLVMATRTLDAAFRGGRVLVQATGGRDAYYVVRRAWNGTPASTTQKLAWPRVGLFHENGAAIASNEIPWELKDAESELAGQLGKKDRTLDNLIAVGGITSARAGPVSVTFRDGYIDKQLLPQAVIDLIPSSWYTEEMIESSRSFDFEVMP